MIVVPPSDINAVIMDYLINEGYPSAAKKFAMEANVQPTEDFASIEARVEIRNAIYAGDIQRAIEKINDVGYQVSFDMLEPAMRPAMLHDDYHEYHAPLIRRILGSDDYNHSSVLSMSEASQSRFGGPS